MTDHIINLLEQKGIQPTAMRMLVLESLLNSNSAKTLVDLEKAMPRADRTTIYRTLKTFVNNGMLHSIDNNSGAQLYALCKEACTNQTHQDCHPHFQCKDCGETICLNKVGIPQILLPEGYQLNEVKLMLVGVCDQCGA